MLLNPKVNPTIEFGFGSNYDEYVIEPYHISFKYPSINLEYNIIPNDYILNDIDPYIDGNSILPNGTYTTSSIPTSGNKKTFILRIDVDRNNGNGPTFSLTSSFTIEFIESIFYKKQKLEHNGDYINYTLLDERGITASDYANNIIFNDTYIRNNMTSYDITEGEVNVADLGNTDDEHMLFAIPSVYQPKFYVNNMYNTAFSKIKEQIGVTFSNNYFNEYDIWTTDTEQNYHLEKIKIKLNKI